MDFFINLISIDFHQSPEEEKSLGRMILDGILNLNKFQIDWFALQVL